MQKWLSVVGIGEDGLAGLHPLGRSLLDQALVIAGGERHLAMLPTVDRRERILWRNPITDFIQEILGRSGQPVCVLASGDPLWYGIGSTLTRYVPIEEMTIIPSVSAFSLACARLGWALPEVEFLSLCGRDPALLNGLLYPQAKILILSADGQTPTQVARQVTQQGFGPSQMTVLEHIGGDRERHLTAIAADWPETDCAALNTIALHCVPESGLRPYWRNHLAGLPDTAYHHDGQLTKREVRAVTLSTLAPQPGELLWDVGAGCGSIAIEWLRSDRRCRAIAIEQHAQRRQAIADNSIALGTPHLQIVAGEAPQALHGLPTPQAIFIGGGLTAPQMLNTCWNALAEGGRLVANAVTIESEQLLFQGQQQWGGSLIRIAIQRAEPIGQFLGWKAMAPVTQWCAVKR